MTHTKLPIVLALFVACDTSGPATPSQATTEPEPTLTDAELQEGLQIGQEALGLTECMLSFLAHAQPTRDELRAMANGEVDPAAVLDISPDTWADYERHLEHLQARSLAFASRLGIDLPGAELPPGLPESPDEAAEQLYEWSRRVAELPEDARPACALGTSATERRDLPDPERLMRLMGLLDVGLQRERPPWDTGFPPPMEPPPPPPRPRFPPGHETADRAFWRDCAAAGGKVEGGRCQCSQSRARIGSVVLAAVASKACTSIWGCIGAAITWGVSIYFCDQNPCEEINRDYGV